MTHTPKPWIIGKYATTSITGPNDRHVATTGGYQSNVDGLKVLAENEANARLIAAAPDLLEALEALNGVGLLSGPDEAVIYDWGELGLSAVKRARAAIAKARGQS